MTYEPKTVRVATRALWLLLALLALLGCSSNRPETTASDGVPLTFPLTITLATPTASDTITADSGLVQWVANGATSSTVTVVIPGNQPLSGVATTDSIQTFSNRVRAFYISPAFADPATGLITVTYSSTATVTVALLNI